MAAPRIRMPKSSAMFTGTVSNLDMMEVRIGNLAELRTQLETWKTNVNKFKESYHDWANAKAAQLRKTAASFAPLEFGLLQNPRLTQAQKTVAGEKKTYEFAVNFMPEYAYDLQFKLWGPVVGNPYRKGTQRKFARLGTPIGPFYATRALKRFEQDISKETSSVSALLKMTDPSNLGMQVRVTRT